MLRVLSCLVLTAVLGGCATLASSSASDYEKSLAIAEAAREAGESESAMAAYRQAVAEEPSHTQPWRQIARLHAQEGQWAQAFAAAQRVLQLEPDDAEAGELLVHSGLQVAGQALQHLQEDDVGQVEMNREQAEALLAQMVTIFGVEAIPAEVLEDFGKTVIDRYRARPFKAPHNRQTPKTPEKTTADPFDVLGDGRPG
ncbi:MAG TPA: tetratricopeptide repeat protein [Lysobacter sp.]|nr:tetratricopeptide repeat protein [Lysobacter sp.]